MLKKISTACILFSTLHCWALPAPQYLMVDQWKKCVNSQTKGQATFICLPAKKPNLCPQSSWEKLNQDNLISVCY